jgi:gamma-glutamylcyclotransferase (GGCT)/AIG2-like uncharacterized protein YtfP
MMVPRIVKDGHWRRLVALRRAALAETDYFFVYGSLLKRYRNFNRFLKHKVKTVEPAYCQGYLYHLPIGFPGLVEVEGCHDLVVGEVMTFKRPEKVMRALDRLEGFHPDDPQKSVYQRRKLPVIVERKRNGKKVFEEIEAWVYVYPQDHLSPEHQKEFFIACGNWKMFSDRPVARRRKSRLRKVFRKLRRRPRVERIHIEPALCMSRKEHAEWMSTAACSRFCRHPELCRSHRRKLRENLF